MIILAIETSCDDTCIALLETKGQKLKIRNNIISSQVKIHAKYGGIYPFLAKREHQKNLPLVFKKAIKGINVAQIDASTSSASILNNSRRIDLIAVTKGPGLEPCLWTGINFAKKLAEEIKKPLIPVNHIEAHILVNFIGSNFQNLFPAICLVVSGGHTQLILMKEIGKYKILGETRDDAAGECFDKTARILGLGYPGGPAIEKIVAKYPAPEQVRCGAGKIHLPRPMIYQKNYDFSFSGLKTAVLYNLKNLPRFAQQNLAAFGSKNQPKKIRKSKKYIQEMCREIQQAIIDVLLSKTLKAAKKYKTKAIILGGGVTANKELRKQFKEKIKKEIPYSKFCIPEAKYCTDNAVMVGITAFYHHKENKKTNKDIKAEANLKI